MTNAREEKDGKNAPKEGRGGGTTEARINGRIFTLMMFHVSVSFGLLVWRLVAFMVFKYPLGCSAPG